MVRNVTPRERLIVQPTGSLLLSTLETMATGEVTRGGAGWLPVTESAEASRMVISRSHMGAFLGENAANQDRSGSLGLTEICIYASVVDVTPLDQQGRHEGERGQLLTGAFTERHLPCPQLGVKASAANRWGAVHDRSRNSRMATMSARRRPRPPLRFEHPLPGAHVLTDEELTRYAGQLDQILHVTESVRWR